MALFRDESANDQAGVGISGNTAMPVDLSPDEQRVLRAGPAGPEDFELVKHLRDYGYTESKCRESRQRDTHGKVLDVIWLGPNAAGKLALERCGSSQVKTDQAEPAQGEQGADQGQPRDQHFLTAIRRFAKKIAFEFVSQFLVALAIAATAAFIAAHFGFSIG